MESPDTSFLFESLELLGVAGCAVLFFVIFAFVSVRAAEKEVRPKSHHF